MQQGWQCKVLCSLPQSLDSFCHMFQSPTQPSAAAPYWSPCAWCGLTAFCPMGWGTGQQPHLTGQGRDKGSPGDTSCPSMPRAGQSVPPWALTLMLGWALSVLTRLCSVSKPSLMLKRLFCSAEMCVMRRLSICGQGLSGTSWHQAQPRTTSPIEDRLAQSSQQRGVEFEGQQEGGGCREVLPPQRRQLLFLPYLAGLRSAPTGHRVAQGYARAQPSSWSWGSLAGLGPVAACQRKGDDLGREAAAAPHARLTPGSHAAAPVCTPAAEQPPCPANGAALTQHPHVSLLVLSPNTTHNCSEMGTSGMWHLNFPACQEVEIAGRESQGQ